MVVLAVPVQQHEIIYKMTVEIHVTVHLNSTISFQGTYEGSATQPSGEALSQPLEDEQNQPCLFKGLCDLCNYI